MQLEFRIYLELLNNITIQSTELPANIALIKYFDLTNSNNEITIWVKLVSNIMIVVHVVLSAQRSIIISACKLHIVHIRKSNIVQQLRNNSSSMAILLLIVEEEKTRTYYFMRRFLSWFKRIALFYKYFSLTENKTR
jgi:hypothetical protein